jgi:hypothetical protein
MSGALWPRQRRVGWHAACVQEKLHALASSLHHSVHRNRHRHSLGNRKGNAHFVVFGNFDVRPIAGSFITGPSAMTICALLLRHRFYRLKPPKRQKYAMLGLTSSMSPSSGSVPGLYPVWLSTAKRASYGIPFLPTTARGFSASHSFSGIGHSRGGAFAQRVLVRRSQRSLK